MQIFTQKRDFVSRSYQRGDTTKPRRGINNRRTAGARFSANLWRNYLYSWKSASCFLSEVVHLTRYYWNNKCSVGEEHTERGPTDDECRRRSLSGGHFLQTVRRFLGADGCSSITLEVLKAFAPGNVIWWMGCRRDGDGLMAAESPVQASLLMCCRSHIVVYRSSGAKDIKKIPKRPLN